MVRLGSPTLKPTAMRKPSHRHQQGLPGGRNTLFKVHVQGHDDKGRGLVGTRTVLAKTQCFFVQWLQVSMAENVHLTKCTRKINVTLSLLIL